MKIDLHMASSFLATHGRVLDRRRVQLVLGEGDAGGILAALDGYRNPDGGYGWALEPDLRSAESQPTAAMHAFEVFAELSPTTTPHAADLCDWLQQHSLADGGLPFALPIDNPAGCSPWWAQADSATSSLAMTAQVAATAHVLARHDPAVAGHPWLAIATNWCLDAIRRIDATPHAYDLLFALRFLDAVADTVPDAHDLLEQTGRHVPPTGSTPVEGGTANEKLHLLDYAPDPDRPIRSLFAPSAAATDIDRLAGLQQADGGWVVDFASSSPAATLEWRGYATLRAVAVLRNNSL
jgi:hypothetical protein